MNMKPAIDYTDRKRSTPKSLHKSVNFTPIRELNKLTSTVMRKIESSRLGASSSKASKDCSTPFEDPNYGAFSFPCTWPVGSQLH